MVASNAAHDNKGNNLPAAASKGTAAKARSDNAAAITLRSGRQKVAADTAGSAMQVRAGIAATRHSVRLAAKSANATNPAAHAGRWR